MKAETVQAAEEGARGVCNLRLVRAINRGGAVHANLYPLHELFTHSAERFGFLSTTFSVEKKRRTSA
jgi:hypothetical protein